jgi:hypothetical protein
LLKIRILRIWLRKKFNIEELTRTKENYRLIELEKNFDWKRFAEIKENATNNKQPKAL